MSGKVYLQTNPDIVFREEEGGAFLFNSTNCILKGLNDTGKLIWELCDGTRAEEDISREILALYPEKRKDEVREDITGFIEKLKQIGYIRSREEEKSE
jgi:hypothetical protein